MENSFLFVGYRNWALETHRNLSKKLPIAITSNEVDDYINLNPGLKYIFYVGWSELISKDILERFECYCLHPSDLPRFRGGSPIQHQILSGVLNSAVTMFKIGLKVDAGPIYKKHFLSLDAGLEKILERISIISAVLINSFILDVETKSEILLVPQDESMATYNKRRLPKDSEISFKELRTLSAEQLSRKINCLVDPYPNAFIVCADGGRLILKDSTFD